MAATAPPHPARVLAFYREDAKHLGVMMALAATLIGGGGLLSSLATMARRLDWSEATRLTAWGAGMTALLAGLSVGFVILPLRVLRHERSLAVERAGVRLVHRHRSEFFGWDDVLQIEAEPDALVLRLRGDGVRKLHATYGGLSHLELARSLESCRRKAQFALL